MVKEHILGLMETCMKGDTRMGKDMVEGPTFGLVETSMKGNTRMGKSDGKGTQTFSDGGKWTGEFRKNKRWNTTIYNKNGNIIGKFVNGTEYDKYGNIIGSGWMGVKQ